jgi:hypothetical protein
MRGLKKIMSSQGIDLGITNGMPKRHEADLFSTSKHALR